MPSASHSRVAWLATTLLSFASVCAEAPPRPHAVDLLAKIQLAANTAALAERAGFILNGIDLDRERSDVRPGDQVTALVAISSFDDTVPIRQWMIRLTVSPDPPLGSNSTETTQYTSLGHKFVFQSNRSVLALETFGPIMRETSHEDATVPRKIATVAVGTDYLTLDLARSARVIQRVLSVPLENRGSISAQGTPFPEKEIAAARKKTASLEISDDDMRSFSGVSPALMQFLRIAQRTPELNAILELVMDKPSAWAVVRNLGSGNLEFELLRGGPVKGRELFWPERKAPRDFSILPFVLRTFGKDVTIVALFVTNPRPPLVASAGVVGAIAFSPDQRNKTVVGIRVLSATRGVVQNEPQVSALIP